MKTNHQSPSSLTLSALIIAFLMSACSSPSVLQHPTTSSTLWMQNAAEYRALTTSVYQAATANLGLAIEDSYWTAYARSNGQSPSQQPPAVILDVDETVLNNSAFQARMIKQNSSFDPQKWNSWVMEAKAEPIPGALAFTKRAAKEGVAVYYLTNRVAKVEEGTRENLKKLGFPLPDQGDHILSKNERSNWTSAKIERRAYVAKNHRILMLFGDNLNDFIHAEGISQEQRYQLVKEYQDKWGRQWYMLPNPVYGSWESALHDFDSSLSPSQIDSIKKASLDTKKN